ncbi:MAG: hypothetical protein MJZ11_10530 [Lachnospiraceae bacterium]|nr:hypothetical protein [Lachnospiraceae bacterium]
MAQKRFIAEPISEEESNEIGNLLADSVRVETQENAEEVRSSWSAEKRETSVKKERAKSKKKEATSKTSELEAKMKASDIDYSRWTNFKRIIFNKPDLSIQEEETKTVVIPISLLERMYALSKNNKKIFVKTIVANLIMDFLEENEDIIEFLEKNNSK